MGAIEKYFHSCLNISQYDFIKNDVLSVKFEKKDPITTAPVDKVNANVRELILHFPQIRNIKSKLVVYITEQSAWASQVVKSLLEKSFPQHILQYYLIKFSNVNSMYALPPGHFMKPPDIFVISSLDESTDFEPQLCHYNNTEEPANISVHSNLLSWREECQQHIQKSIATINANNVLFINGEPLSLMKWLTKLKVSSSSNKIYQRNYVILNAYDSQGMSDYLSERKTNKIVVEYLPNAATSFANILGLQEFDMQLLPRVDNSMSHVIDANVLLRRRSRMWALNSLRTKQRNVAYLYFRCDRLAREHMFALLHATMPAVDALGACDGHGHYHRSAGAINKYVAGRFSDFYITQAIKVYQPYKFVISFENSIVKGYITEKLTNAFLAHAVPIYFGAPDVAEYFNQDAFINCHHFDTFEDCATYVQVVNQDDDLYLSYLQAQPVVDIQKWCNFFQWQHEIIRHQCLQYSTLGNNIAVSIAETFEV